jgi:hypothetical protein
MIESNYFKIALICLGSIIILSNFINFQSLISNLIFRAKTKKIYNEQDDFLQIVSLWYQLKNKCDECKLTVASNKLDEVFPLLNGALENEQVN